MLERFDMMGRVAIITGGSGGLGSGTAAALAEAGANLVLTARGGAGLARAAARVKELGREVLTVPADAGDLSVLPGIVDAAVERFGRIDALVNIVGGTGPAPLMDTTSAHLEDAFHLNVTVAFELSKLVAPHMLAGAGGAIVNTSSAMGHLRDRGFVAYGTAKAAVEHMTRHLAADMAPRIRVNAIAPGAILTDSLAAVLTEDATATMISMTPLRRLGAPEDIALMALFLVSDAGSFVTGKVFHVDGGIETPNLPLGIPDLEAP